MVILGIDPGLSITGYGCVELEGKDINLVEGGVIRTHSREKLELRLASIFNGLNRIVENVKPENIVVEELYSHYAHPLTAVKMGYVRGIVFLVAANYSIPVWSYSATRIKKSLTGNGKSSKEAVQKAIKLILNLKDLPYPPDVSDALAIALCHANVVSRKNIL